MSEATLKRVVVEHEWGDPFVFDLVIDQLIDKPKKIPTGGWWGRLKTNDLLPFIFRGDGRIDFGARPEDSIDELRERFASCNIHLKKLRVGEVISFFIEDEETTGIIKQVELLS